MFLSALQLAGAASHLLLICIKFKCLSKLYCITISHCRFKLTSKLLKTFPNVFLFFYLYDVFLWLKLVRGLKEMTDQIVQIVQHTLYSSERFRCLCFWRATSHLFIQKGNWFKCQDTFLWNVRVVRSVVGLLTTRFDYCAEVLIIVHVYILRWCECVLHIKMLINGLNMMLFKGACVSV